MSGGSTEGMARTADPGSVLEHHFLRATTWDAAGAVAAHLLRLRYPSLCRQPSCRNADQDIVGGNVVAATKRTGRRRARTGIVELRTRLFRTACADCRLGGPQRGRGRATSNLRMVTRGGVHGFCATDPPSTAASLFGNDRQAIEIARVHFRHFLQMRLEIVEYSSGF
jgi:hypothetical protein